jgi:hypothetical protein
MLKESTSMYTHTPFLAISSDILPAQVTRGGKPPQTILLLTARLNYIEVQGSNSRIAHWSQVSEISC